MAGYCKIRVRNIYVCVYKYPYMCVHIYFTYLFIYFLMSDDSTCLKSHYFPTEFKVHGQIVFNMNVSPQFKRAQG